MGTLRFLLAFAVAAGHVAGDFHFSSGFILPGSRAVQIFYVISGFLIAFILDGKYAKDSAGIWLFYSNRALRIFVPYFAVLIATIALSFVTYCLTGSAVSLGVYFAEAGKMTLPTWIYAIFTNIFLFGMEYGYMLVYRAGHLLFDLRAFYDPPMAAQFSIDTPAWTLSLELTFYLLAPLLLRQHFLLIALTALSAQIFRNYGYQIGWYSEATDYRFFPFELGLFLFGALIYRARSLLNVEPRWAAVATLALVVFMIRPTRFLVANQYLLYMAAGLLLPALFQFTNAHRWDRWLGELSYPLYIVHWPVLAFAVIFAGTDKHLASPILTIAVAVGLSICMHHFLVNPVDRWRQRRLPLAAKLSTPREPEVVGAAMEVAR